MLCLKNINIIFHKKVLVCQQLSFPNTGLCIIKGESGSGKTSLINCLMMKNNFYESYTYNDREMTKDLIEEKISILTQNQNFIEDLLIIDHIKLIEKIFSFDKKDEYISRLQLEKLLYKYPNQLSGGEKTRVGLLLKIMKQPEIIILDEPTASLDLYYTEIVLEIIKEYSLNHLVIVTTHDLVIIDHADILYEIKNKSLTLIKDSHHKDNNILKKENKKNSFPMMKLNLWLKKKYKLYYIGLYCLLAILILLSSFGISLNIGEKVGSDTFSSVYQDEILVYKSQFPLSGSGNEYPLSEEEIHFLKSLKHVKDVEETYIYSHVMDIVTEENHILNMTGEDSFNLTLYEKNKERKKLNYRSNEKYYGSFAYCSYNEHYDYSQDIEVILDNKENGVYVSQAVADLLDLKKSGQDYEIEFYLMIPTHQIYGDAIIPYQNEDGSFGPEGDPVLEWMGIKEKVRLPINGILKSSQMGVGINQHMSLFFPNQFIQNKIKQHKSLKNYSYYYDDKIYYYKSGIKNNKKIIEAKPYKPIIYRLKIDNLSYIEDVMNEVRNNGLSVTTGDYSKALRTYENNTDKMILYVTSILLVVLSLIYVIIEYLKKDKNIQMKIFVESFGIKNSQRIIARKHFIDFIFLEFLVFIIGIIYAFGLGPIMNYPIHFTYAFIPISILLSFIIMFLIPLLVFRLRK